jgi:predicted RNA methylase
METKAMINVQLNTPAQIETAAAAPALGTPAIDAYGKIGFVVDVQEESEKIWTLGTGRMVKQAYRVTIAWESGVSTNSESITAPMLARGAHLIPLGRLEIGPWHEAALKAQEAAREAGIKERDATKAMQEASKAKLDALAPDWAKSVIVATLEQDDSDSMTDYFNVKSRRYVVLAFSPHTRDIFSELRKAAALFPETAELATADSSAEHREKYSMGAGYYLKKGGRYRSGWKVSKEDLGYAPWGLELEVCEALTAPKAQSAQKANQPESAGRFTIEKHIHTLKGFEMWICTMQERVERAEYDSLLAEAKALGGWYSRAWNGTPAGFAFKKEAAALAFAGGQDPAPSEGPKPGKPKAESAPETDKGQAMADKLEAMAESLSAKIQERLADRLSNTPKRAKQAAEARQDGYDLQRAQKAMKALAACWKAGSVPDILRPVVTKAALVELAQEGLDHSRGGYYTPGAPTGKPRKYQDATEAAKAAALWALLDAPKDPAAESGEQLRRKLDDLRFAKIPGYFPTPAALVQRMLDESGVKPGARVLEPSAGSGNIANAAKAAGLAVTCFEKWHSLADVLKLQGHEVTQGDFLEVEAPADPESAFDCVLMNPPFENGQDIEHVLHAYRFLKSGGVLVSIMSASVSFASSRKAEAFRAFIDDTGGELIALPSGSFKESATGVETVMVKLWAA